MTEQEMLTVEQCDREAAETIGGFMAAFYEFNRRSDYEEACEEAAKFRLAATKAADERVRVMEGALQKIATGTYDGLEVDHYNASHCRRIARAALAEATQTPS